jgi:hypothetical protein
LDGKVDICGAKDAKEAVFECLDGSFCGIDAVVIWFDELKANILRL